MAHCRTNGGNMADPSIYQFGELQKSKINDNMLKDE